MLSKFEKPEDDVFVYGLVDPNTKELRYIGQTQVGLNRFKYHYYEAGKFNKLSGVKSASKNWIQSLKDKGQCFEVLYLEFCSIEELDEIEKFYINYFKYIGSSLLNHEEGGKRIGGISQNTRKFISERTKLGMNNPEVKAICRKNAYKNIAGKNKGKKFNTKTRLKISEAQEKFVYYFLIDDLKIRGMKNLAKYLDCTLSAVNHYVSGRCKTVKGRTPTIVGKGHKQ